MIPAFTQEFRVRGGQSEVWQKCKIVFKGKRYTVVENETGKEFSRKTAKIMIRDITPQINLENGATYQFDVVGHAYIGIYKSERNSFFDTYLPPNKICGKSEASNIIKLIPEVK